MPDEDDLVAGHPLGEQADGDLHLIGSVRRGSYHGMRAAIWEYSYTPNGHPTHGLDISFVSPSRSWGYSVLWLIPEDRWRSSQELIRSFEQAFSPLA